MNYVKRSSWLVMLVFFAGLTACSMASYTEKRTTEYHFHAEGDKSDVAVVVDGVAVDTTRNTTQEPENTTNTKTAMSQQGGVATAAKDTVLDKIKSVFEPKTTDSFNPVDVKDVPVNDPDEDEEANKPPADDPKPEDPKPDDPKPGDDNMYGFNSVKILKYAGPISIDKHHNAKWKLPKGTSGPSYFGKKIAIKYPDGYVAYIPDTGSNYDHARRVEGKKRSYNYRPGNENHKPYEDKKNKDVFSAEFYFSINQKADLKVFYDVKGAK